MLIEDEIIINIHIEDIITLNANSIYLVTNKVIYKNNIYLFLIDINNN